MSKDENKRIDLKQFEGMSEGPWAYTHDPEEGLIIMGGNTMVAELSFLFTNMSPETDETNPSGLDPDAVDARVILASPDLIAALKKAYEEIDLLRRKIRLLDVVHDIPNALDAEIKGYGHFRDSFKLLKVNSFIFVFRHLCLTRRRHGPVSVHVA